MCSQLTEHDASNVQCCGQWSVVSGQWAVSQVDSCKIVYINKNASFRVPPSCLVSRVMHSRAQNIQQK
jgi:hypothetical protein